MDITLTIPTEQAPRILEAVVGVYPKVYAEGEEEPTDGAWAKIQLIEFLKRTVNRYERKEAIDDIVIESIDGIT